MTQEFGRDYWDQHWDERGADDSASMATSSPNPYLVRETRDLVPGTALDAGCGAGAEAIWLASHNWRVTGVDISQQALALAAERAAASGLAHGPTWVEADLSVWRPDVTYDLVTTHYAHPTIPQLRFYERIADWVRPGGTLLVVGHWRSARPVDGAISHGHAHQPAPEASATASAVAALFGPESWVIVTAEECRRTLGGHGNGGVRVDDFVVRATRSV